MNKTILLVFILLNLKIYSQTIEDTLDVKEAQNELHEISRKKNVLSVEGILWFPFIRYYLIKNSKYNGHELNSKGNLIYGGRIGYIHYTSSTFGFGFEGYFEGTRYGANAAVSLYSPTEDYSQITRVYESFNIQTFALLAKIEWNKKSDKLPFGVSHQFGIGVSTNSVADKNYSYEYYEFYGDKIEYASSNPVRDFDSSHRLFIGVLAVYSLNMRFKLTENLAAIIGGRVQVNAIPASFNSKSVKNYDFSTSDLAEIIQSSQMYAPYRFNFGLSYIF